MKKPINMQSKLAKYLARERNLSWHEYLQRFQGTQPLELYATDIYPKRLNATDDKWDEEEPIIFKSSSYEIKRMQRIPQITVNFKGKVTKEEVENLPYINARSLLAVSFLIREDVIELMQKICPDDFEPIPVKLVNLHKDSEHFETNKYYDLNILNCIDAIDQDKSIIEWSETTGLARISISVIRYKENPWQDGALRYSENGKLKYRHFKLDKPCKLAIDAITGSILWHPELARQMPTNSYHWFMRDEEQFTWRTS